MIFFRPLRVANCRVAHLRRGCELLRVVYEDDLALVLDTWLDKWVCSTLRIDGAVARAPLSPVAQGAG